MDGEEKDKAFIVRDSLQDSDKLKDYGLQTPIEELKKNFYIRHKDGKTTMIEQYLQFYKNVTEELLKNKDYTSYFKTREGEVGDSREEIKKKLMEVFGKYKETISFEDDIKIPFYNLNATLSQKGGAMDAVKKLFDTEFAKIPTELKDFVGDIIDGNVPEVVDGIIGEEGDKKITTFSKVNLPENIWGSLNNVEDSLINRTNEADEYYQGGGATQYFLDENKTVIEDYLKKCSDIERLYVRKHIEYLSLYVFFRELVKCNYDLNLAIQAVTKLKGRNETGEPISIGMIESVHIPKDFITNIETLLTEQGVVLDELSTKVLQNESEFKVKAIFYKILKSIEASADAIKTKSEKAPGEDAGAPQEASGIESAPEGTPSGTEDAGQTGAPEEQNGGGGYDEFKELIEKMGLNLNLTKTIGFIRKQNDEQLTLLITRVTELLDKTGNEFETAVDNFLSEELGQHILEYLKTEDTSDGLVEEIETKDPLQQKKNEISRLIRTKKEELKTIKENDANKDFFELFGEVESMYYTIKNIDGAQLSGFTRDINADANNIYTLGEKFMKFDAELDKFSENVNNEETELDDLIKLEENVNKLEIPEQNIEYDTSTNEGAVYAVISDYMEKVVGAARVIVKYRDDIIDANQEALTGAGDKMVRRHKDSTRCVVMPNRDCSESICDTDEKAMVYGPFKNVFNEEENTDVIFEKTFLEGGIIKSLFEGKSAVIFGFGFSGSGKTYQLAAKGNKMSILAQTINALLAKKRINSEGKQIGDPLEYEGTVSEMTLDIKELYPYTDLSKGVNNVKKADTVKFYGDNNGTEEEKTYFVKFLNDNTWKSTEKLTVQEYIDNIMAINENIENDRINHMRITPTPNNPESSRSHIFYNFKFKLSDGNEGSFVIVDMAGSENTIEIRRDFLLGSAYNEWYKNTDQKNMLIPAHFYSPDIKKKHQNAKKIFKFIFGNLVNAETITNLVFKGLKKKFMSLGQESITNTAFWSIANSYIDITLMANKMDLLTKNKDNASEIKIKNVKKLTPQMFINMIDVFQSKITSSYELKESGGITYQGKPVNNPVNDAIINQIFNMIKKYFNPEEILLLNWDDESIKITIKEVFDKGYYLKHNLIGTLKDENGKDKLFEVKGKGKEKGEKEAREFSFEKSSYKLGSSDNFKLLQSSNNINYKNPIHIILAVYVLKLNEIYNECIWDDNILLGQQNFKSFVSGTNRVNFVYLLQFFAVIARYINVVCNQGVGIVTTLEHLKYFFLYNTVDHQMLYKYNKKHKDNKKENRALTVPTDDITASKTFTVGNEGEFQETVENGMFQQYKVLELLTQFATKTPGAKLTHKGWTGVDGVNTLTSNLTETKKSGSAGNESSEGSKPSFSIVNLPHPKGNKYIMLTAIRRGEKAHMLSQTPSDESKTNNKKYCAATKATLEFAESITSFPKPCQGIEDKNQLSKLKEGVQACSTHPTNGGGKVSHKNKRNFNISNKRSKLNKKFIQRGGDLDYGLDLVGQIEEIKTLEEFKKYFTGESGQKIIESDRQARLSSFLKKADSKIGGYSSMTEEDKKQVRKKFVMKLIENASNNTLFKKLEQYGVDLVSKDAVVSDNNAKFIMRKGSTVKNYFDQVLAKIFKEIENQGNIGEGLATSTTLTDLNYNPSGNLTNLQQLQDLLNHNKLKLQLQNAGAWISTKVGPDFNESYFSSSITETNTLTETDEIQLRLDKCQDLEVLYAVKHFEVFEITKPIIYFLDTLAKNIILYAYILSLYGDAEKIGEIKFDKQVVNIEALQPFITEFKKLVDEQKQIQEVIGTITPGQGVSDKKTDTAIRELRATIGGNRKNSKKRRRKLTRKGNKQRNSAKNRYNKVRKVRKNVRKTKRN